jgi:hypothetical protein
MTTETPTRRCEACEKELYDKRWFTCSQCPPDPAGVKPVFCRDCIAGHVHDEGDNE